MPTPKTSALLFWLVAACTAETRDDGTGVFSVGESGTAPGTDTGVDPGTGDSSATGAETSGPFTKLDVGAPETSGQPGEIAEVFGHSADTLYRLDPETKEVEAVGALTDCTASIIDIALDADSNMFGAAYGSLWSIDRSSGQCTRIASGDYPTSLSFVPAGTVDADDEALVGFVDDEYIRIDTETGAVTTLGALTDGLRSSGDMVSVDGGSWLTVTDNGACSDFDCIVEIDPFDGSVIQHYGALPYAQVFGLAFWAGRAYGFARDGSLFEIEFGADSVTTTPIAIPGAPAQLEFFGAGSTTSAPPAQG